MPNTKVRAHNLANTSVTAGSYGGGGQAAAITVDAQGRITAASNVTRTTTATVNLNAWNHIAVSRSGSGSNNLTIYVNGVGESYTETGAFTHSGSSLLSIGADTNGDEGRMHGYLSGLRMINGRSIYSGASISIPTTPATPVSGTTLLLNGTNGSIIDSTARNFLSTLGNTQIRNNIKRYDNASLFFDGSGDNLSAGALVSSPQLSFGTGNFTIEGWFYFNDVNSRAALINQGWGDSGYDTQGGFTFDIAGISAGQVSLAVGTMNAGAFWIANAGSFVTGTWYHIALVRNGTNISIYSNGQSIGSNTLTSASTIVGNMGKLHIGSYSGNSLNFNGYIDDFRVTKGIARYTSNFTVPSKHKLK